MVILYVYANHMKTMRIFGIDYYTLNIIMMVVIIILLQIHALLVKPLKHGQTRLWQHSLVVCAFISCLSLAAEPWIVSFCKAMIYPLAPPVTVPIYLTRAGNKLEMAFRVKDDSTCVFKLEFHYSKRKQDDVNIVQKIAGYNCGFWNSTRKPVTGKLLDIYGYEEAKRMVNNPFMVNDLLVDETFTCEGTIIPINLTLYKMQGERRVLILEKSYMTQGVNEQSDGAFIRNFAFKSLQEGKYIAIFENPQGFPDLTGRDIRVSIYKFVAK